jgi:hypothetical protein
MKTLDCLQIGDEVDVLLRTRLFGSVHQDKEHNMTVIEKFEDSFYGMSTIDGSKAKVSYSRVRTINGMEISRYQSSLKKGSR